MGRAMGADMAKGASITVRVTPCTSVTMRSRDVSPRRSTRRSTSVACVPSGPTLIPPANSQPSSASYSSRSFTLALLDLFMLYRGDLQAKIEVTLKKVKNDFLTVELITSSRSQDFLPDARGDKTAFNY